MIKIINFVTTKIENELSEHSQIEFVQPSQPLGQSISQGQPQSNSNIRTDVH